MMFLYNIGDAVEIIESVDYRGITSRYFPKGSKVVISSCTSKDTLINNIVGCNENNTENLYRVCEAWRLNSNCHSIDNDMIIRESYLKAIKDNGEIISLTK